MQGADRPVEWHELQRFTEVPLEVTFYPPADPSDKKPSSEAGDEESGPTKGPLTTHVMFVADILGTDQVVWKLADVKANSPGIVHSMLLYALCSMFACVACASLAPKLL